MDAVDGDAARAVRGARLPERARVTRANAERLGTEQQFWCTTKCFVRDVLEAREIAIVDDASDGGEGVDDGRASELYEMRGRASEGEGDGTKASETKASFVARRVEVCGFVVEKRRRKDSKVIFTVDDGSGCVECVVWTQDGDAVSGEQMELLQQTLVKRMPSAANRSIAGVWQKSFSQEPYAPMPSDAWSSDIMKRMFGRVAGLVCAWPSETSAKRPTKMNRIRCIPNGNYHLATKY